MDFWPRLADVKYAESPVGWPARSFTHGGPKARESSPTLGRSTLMTSAPRSARFCPAQGPARTRDRSRTRTCDNGPAMTRLSIGNCGNLPEVREHAQRKPEQYQREHDAQPLHRQ